MSGSEYDAILKDDKKKPSKIAEISNKNAGKPNYVLIDLFLIIVIIVVSYVIYYNSILSGKNIFLNDFLTIYNEYINVVDNFYNGDVLSDNINFTGYMEINNDGNINSYDVYFNYDKDSTLLKLFNDDKSIEYYNSNNLNLIKSSLISDSYIDSGIVNVYDYIVNYSDLYNNIVNYLENEDNYSRELYFEDEKPIVKIEYNLTKDNINSIINDTLLYLKDDYSINVTLLNNAITNNIISVKVIINNKTTEDRDVYTYKDGIITYSNDNGDNKKIEIKNTNDDFELKYYDNDVLYSVFKGTKESDSYNYLYQVIDCKYTLKLNVSNSDNISNYLFSINIDVSDKKYNVSIDTTLTYTDDTIINELSDDVVDKSSLSDEEVNIYNNLINNILGFDLKDALTFSD